MNSPVLLWGASRAVVIIVILLLENGFWFLLTNEILFLASSLSEEFLRLRRRIIRKENWSSIRWTIPEMVSIP